MTDIIIAVLWGIAVAGIGGSLTKLTPWYYGLRKPSWQPPDWAFPVGWTVILTLASVAFYLAWKECHGVSEHMVIGGLFVLNGILNILWSPLFFVWQRPDWALKEVPWLWASVLLLMMFSSFLSMTAVILLLPYLLWVTFAAFLNLWVVILNAPFNPSR